MEYEWTPTQGLDNAQSANPIATSNSPVTYTVTVTDDLGCTGSASVTIGMLPPPEVFAWNDQVIDLGDRHFEVIHTPGHSPGGIALWEAASGILFSGDIVYDGPLIEDTHHANPRDYHASMVRLFDLPVRMVHGGHFPSYGAARHKEMIRAWLAAKEA